MPANDPANPVRLRYAELRAQADAHLAQRHEEDRLRIQVGSATCENAAGAGEVFAEFQRHLETSQRSDVVLRQTGCTGRCSREPIVGVMLPGQLPVFYEAVTPALAHEIFLQHVVRGQPLEHHRLIDGGPVTPPQREFLFCTHQRCATSLGHRDLREAFIERLGNHGITRHRALVGQANCFGLCSSEVEGKVGHVLVRPDNVLYRIATEDDLEEMVARHAVRGEVVQRLRVEEEAVSERFFDLYGGMSFFSRQSRIALRNSGVVDPENVFEYVHYQGFAALARVLERGDPDWVIHEVTRSRLRGRGGGGYLTGLKWQQGRDAPGDEKFVICNADEGDPGAFMDRSMLEGDPFSILEGMVIGGYAIGAHQGYLYIRAEYPLAIRRIEQAIRQARELGLLGPDVLGSGYAFDLEIRLGAGAFVCGEETALIRSIEGDRGQPMLRPPYPTQHGLWGKPTVINNVETWTNVPVVILYGARWFAQLGTAKSGGTKVFALAGKVQHTGLVEVPIGTSLREIVEEIGGGVPHGKKLKAIQTGGPAGGCIPADQIDLTVDFDTLTRAGSMMGSGGMIVLDEDDCAVDIAKFFMTFSADESCGKCTPCREGTTRMRELLERITGGQGTLDDLAKLERLGRLLQQASLCGLGRAAPNPVLSTMRLFAAEYRAHVVEKRCPAGRCAALRPANEQGGKRAWPKSSSSPSI